MALRRRSQTTDLAYKMAHSLVSHGDVRFTMQGNYPNKGELRGDDAAVEAFLDTYARDLHTLVPLSIRERLPAIGAFRFFVDLECAELPPPDGLRRLCSKLIATVRVHFYADAGLAASGTRGMVCTSRHDSGKTLVRVLFDGLFVNREQAVAMRATIVSELHDLDAPLARAILGGDVELHDGRFCERWEEAVLRHYLDADGPLLFGAYPAQRCPGVDERGCTKRTHCSVCMRDGFIFCGEQLQLHSCFDASGRVDEARALSLKASWASLLEVALLQAPDSTACTPGWAQRDGAPQVALQQHANRAPALAATFPVERRRRAGELMTDPHKTLLLLRAIRSFADGRYANILIKKVFRCANGSYVLYVRGSGSSYCLFHRGDHDDDLIYFIVSKDGIAQHCNVCAGCRPKARPMALSDMGKYTLGFDYPRSLGGDFHQRLRDDILPMLDAIRHGNLDPYGRPFKRARAERPQ